MSNTFSPVTSNAADAGQTYTEIMRNFFAAYDAEGALGFLRQLFHDPANNDPAGRPSDYQRNAEELEEKRREQLPSLIHDAIVAGFNPTSSASERVAKLSREAVEHLGTTVTPKMRVMPLNAAYFSIGAESRGSVSLVIGHQVPGDDVSGDLETTFISERDCQEDDSTWKLPEGECAKVCYRGEEISGRLLYIHLKAALYLRYLKEVAESFCQDPVFATLPKRIPFPFVFRTTEYETESLGEALLIPLAVVDEKSLPANPHADAWRAAAATLLPPTPGDYFEVYKNSICEPDSEKFGQLFSLAEKSAPMREIILAHADAALAYAIERAKPDSKIPQNENLIVQAGHYHVFLWKLVTALPEDQVFMEQVVDFTRRHFAAAQPPVIKSETRLRYMINEIIDFLDACEAERMAIPEKIRIELNLPEPVFPPHPLWVVYRQERVHPYLAQARQELDNHDPAPSPSLVGKEVPGLYVDALGELLAMLPDTFYGNDDGHLSIITRLAAIGPHARRLEPQLVAKFEKWYEACGEPQRVVEEVGYALYRMGIEQPHQLVSARLKHYGPPAWIAKWCTAAATARLGILFREIETVAAKNKSLPLDVWENALDTSKPGLAAAQEAFDKNRKINLRVLLASLRVPPGVDLGPKLKAFIEVLLGKALVDGDISMANDILDRMPDAAGSMRQYFNVAAVAAILQAPPKGSQADVAAAELARRLAQCPVSAALQLIHIHWTLENQGTEAAIVALCDAVKVLGADDIIYRVAFFELMGDEARIYKPDAAMALLLIETAWGCFREDVYDSKENLRLKNSDFYHYSSNHIWRAVKELTTMPVAEREALVAGRREAMAYETLLAADLTPKNIAAAVVALGTVGCTTAIALAEKLAGRKSCTEDPAVVNAILSAYGRLAPQDERARVSLGNLLWDNLILRPHAVRDAVFRGNLAQFVDDTRKDGTATAREICEVLRANGLLAEVAPYAHELNAWYVINIFKTILAAFFDLRDYDGAAALITRVLEDVEPNDPNYVLLHSNLAVVHMHAGRYDEAGKVFDALFAQDFRRFLEYQPSETDEAFNEIFKSDDLFGGGTEDEKLTATFRNYYGGAKFNLACLRALTNRPDDAIAALKEAVQLHPYTADRLLAENDFASLHETPEFRAILASLE